MLFIGQTDTKSLRDYYYIDKEARGINLGNVKNFLADKLDKKFGVFYTSCKDLDSNLDYFMKVCLKCDPVVYSPPEEWIDEQDKEITERYLNLVYTQKEVKNWSLLTDLVQLKLNDVRKTDAPQLWISGCSCSAAVGVKDDQRWGHLLSNKLKLKASFLAKDGSGIRYQVDQILCSDVRESDIVILQLTGLNRYDYFIGHLEHLGINSFNVYPPMECVFPSSRLTEIDLLEKTIRSFIKLKNFCDKVNAKLVIFNDWGIADRTVLDYLNSFEHFYQLPYDGEFIDLGTDGVHPGPKQHQAYANFLYEKLK